ncbi:MAG: Bax inhibitor-1/YccA family protein [Pseudomonadota bacterium]|nr:Bax inhibitor-1/YccA family protein [Pseudomonadota bacterium]
MTQDFRTTTSLNASELAINKVLRNTYLLLGLTVLFSAFTAYLSMSFNVAPPNIFILLIGMFGLSYLTSVFQNSAIGLVCIFAFTGFMGYTLGPILNLYLYTFANGQEIVTTALGATGIIFLSLSSYVITTRANFSYMGGFLFAAITIAFIVGLGAVIFQMPLLNLIISGVFALISSALVLFHTSEIIHGGQRNYIIATISIYMALFNLFVSLLRIFAAFASNRD